jgi:hypothetical protein
MGARQGRRASACCSCCSCCTCTQSRFWRGSHHNSRRVLVLRASRASGASAAAADNPGCAEASRGEHPGRVSTSGASWIEREGEHPELWPRPCWRFKPLASFLPALSLTLSGTHHGCNDGSDRCGRPSQRCLLPPFGAGDRRSGEGGGSGGSDYGSGGGGSDRLKLFE